MLCGVTGVGAGGEWPEVVGCALRPVGISGGSSPRPNQPRQENQPDRLCTDQPLISPLKVVD